MKVDARKNRKLIKQFPFIDAILKQRMMPFGQSPRPQNGPGSIDGLTIKVQKADEDLLFRQAGNIGLGEDSFVFSMAKDRTNQVKRIGEYLFAVDKNNTIINRLDWPMNKQLAIKRHPVYAKNIFWATNLGDGHLTDSILDKVANLVWVTVSTWHRDTKVDTELGSRFGECLERNIEITIYGEPECGFNRLDEGSSIWSNLRLNQEVITRAICDKESDLLQMLGCLWELCKFFQDEVWDKGMKQALEGFKTRGASGQFGSTKVLVAEMCGYHRVMFQNDSCWVSFQLRPGAIDMYVLGQDGTLPQLRQLVRPMILMWIQKPECHANFKADEQVSVM